MEYTKEAEELFVNNQGLIGFFCAKYKSILANTSYDYQDIYQEVGMATWEAALRFDATKGASFSTYVGHVVFNRLLAIRRHLRCPKCNSGTFILSIDALIPNAEELSLLSMLESPDNVEDLVCTKIDIQNELNAIPKRIVDAALLYAHGLSQMEISEELSISQAQVSRDINKVKLALEEAIV